MESLICAIQRTVRRIGTTAQTRRVVVQIGATQLQDFALVDAAVVTDTDHKRSNVRVGAITGALIGVAAAILAYKDCADASPQSDKSTCAVILVAAPVVIGGGALIGGLLGRMFQP